MPYLGDVLVAQRTNHMHDEQQGRSSNQARKMGSVKYFFQTDLRQIVD